MHIYQHQDADTCTCMILVSFWTCLYPNSIEAWELRCQVRILFKFMTYFKMEPMEFVIFLHFGARVFLKVEITRESNPGRLRERRVLYRHANDASVYEKESVFYA